MAGVTEDIGSRDAHFYDVQEKRSYASLPIVATYTVTPTYVAFEALVVMCVFAELSYRIWYFVYAYRCKRADMLAVFKGHQVSQYASNFCRWLIEAHETTAHHFVNLFSTTAFLVGLFCYVYYVNTFVNKVTQLAPKFKRRALPDVFARAPSFTDARPVPDYSVIPATFNANLGFSLGMYGAALLVQCVCGLYKRRQFVRSLLGWGFDRKRVVPESATDVEAPTPWYSRCAGACSKLMTEVNSVEYVELNQLSDNDSDDDDDRLARGGVDSDDGTYGGSSGEDNDETALTKRAGGAGRLNKLKTALNRRLQKKKPKELETHNIDPAIMGTNAGYLCMASGEPLLEPSTAAWRAFEFGDSGFRALTVLYYVRLVDLVAVLIGANLAHRVTDVVYGEDIVMGLLITHLVTAVVVTVCSAFTQARALLLPLLGFLFASVGILQAQNTYHPNRVGVDVLCGINILVISLICIPLHFMLTLPSAGKRRDWTLGKDAVCNLYTVKKGQ